MARKTKAKVDYFSHDTTHGSTIFILKSRWGNDGYAVWFQLLEKLGATDGHYLDCRNNATFIHLSAYCGVSQTLLMEILDTLAELEAIDANLWQQKIVFCQHFIDRITDAYRRRQNALPSLEKVIDSINSINDGKNEINDGKSTQREREREREIKPLFSSSPLLETLREDAPASEQTAKMMTINDFRFIHSQAFGTNMPAGCNQTARDLCDRFTRDAIAAAFETAAVQGKQSVAYVRGILLGNGNGSIRQRGQPVSYADQWRETAKREMDTFANGGNDDQDNRQQGRQTAIRGGNDNALQGPRFAIGS